MVQDLKPEIYQVHIWIRQISPMIWRRLLMRSDSTLADLHYIIQITFGWTDFHLHRFRLRGQDYGIPRAGGLWYSKDARCVMLDTFNFRRNERFLYREAVEDSLERLRSLLKWLTLEQFDRCRVNRRLKQYALGEEGWRWA